MNSTFAHALVLSGEHCKGESPSTVCHRAKKGLEAPVSQPVDFILAVGGWFIGNKGKYNRPQDSASNLFTDLCAYPVRCESHLCTPRGIKDPINLFIIKM